MPRALSQPDVNTEYGYIERANAPGMGRGHRNPAGTLGQWGGAFAREK